MQQHFEHHFAATPAEVVAMYADTDFAHARATATGALSTDVVLDGKPPLGAFTLAIRRTMPTSDIQAEFRGLLGETLGVRYTEAWEPADAEDDDARAATFAVEIIGAPARASGTITVEPDGDGSLMTYDATVSASVPFLQQMVVGAVSDALARGLEAEFEAADEWLARS